MSIPESLNDEVHALLTLPICGGSSRAELLVSAKQIQAKTVVTDKANSE